MRKSPEAKFTMHKSPPSGFSEASIKFCALPRSIGILKKSSSNYDKPELIDLGLILCSMGGFGLILNACVCLNGMYSCIPCSFCKFTQVEPSSRSVHGNTRRTSPESSYSTTDTSRHLEARVDQPAPIDFDDGLPSYDEIFPPKAEL